MADVRRRRTGFLPALAAMLLPFGAACADPALWSVRGKSNTVYLFGSVHLLQQGGFAIGGELGRAYRDAKIVCFEVDLGALTPETTAAVTLERAIDPQGRGLYDLLGSSAPRVREAAADAGIDLTPFASFEPWFAGISVSVLALQKRGYDADQGVEQVIEREAQKDGKQGCGLETFDEQLGLLDSLPAGEQLELLLQSLDESKGIEDEMRRLYDAWKDGDDGPLVRQLDEDFADYPDLADRLIYARNERWADQVAALLERPDDVLLVVGALHLVGDRGLPAKLEQRGFTVRRH